MMPEYILAEDDNGKLWKLKLTLEKATDQIEIYRFSIGKKSFAWRNNRPLLRKQNSRKKIDWKLIDGQVKDATFMANVLEKLKQLIKEEEGKGINAQIEWARDRKTH